MTASLRRFWDKICYDSLPRDPNCRSLLLHSRKGEASRTWGCSAGAKKTVEWNTFDRARQKKKNPMHRFDPEVEEIALTVQAHQQRPRKSSCGWKIKKKRGLLHGISRAGSRCVGRFGVVFFFFICFNPFLLCFLISDYKF
jgi:hypothetical protein